MRSDYIQWLDEQPYTKNAQASRLSHARRVEQCYGDLDEHYVQGTYQSIIDSLQYSTEDEHHNKPNPSKIPIDGHIRNNLQSYKSAVVLYRKYLENIEPQETTTQLGPKSAIDVDGISSTDDKRQRLSLERDMQAALRNNIASLDASLRIIDDGAERAVNSGLIDITCEDNHSIVVVELKAGKADNRAIGQILGYMGDLQEDEEKPVRGILVAHEFDRRTKSAARVVPTLTLKRYAIEFTFTDEE